MKALNKKLLRNLWEMRGQAIAIALVIVGGVATFVMSLSTLDSLQLTRDVFYRDYRFAEIFVSLKRAPEGLRSRINDIPGVEQAETRVVADVKLDIAGYESPVRGRLVSISDDGSSAFNRLYLRKGRFIEPGQGDEIMVGEAFAEAHKLEPGDMIGAVINGRRRDLIIAGITLSPEYIFQLNPGSAIPDFERYGVLWMGRTALSNAFDMEGAFNDVVLTLSKDANPEDVIEKIDKLLEPYGGLGAYSRKDQISHKFLSEEFRQLGEMATIYPVIFLGVAAFLLNVVISRLISTQREEAAVLKAFGYSNMDIGIHYLKLVGLIVFLGISGGIGAGVWLGEGLSRMYMQFYRFPFLEYKLNPAIVLEAFVISMSAATAGTVYSIWKASRIPPAEAMRPEPPAVYRETLVERLGFNRLFSAPTKMIARNIERRPLKAALSILGISLACAILLMSRLFADAVDFMMDVHFNLSQREDMMVAFTEPTSRKAMLELGSMPGIKYAEPYRLVPARFRYRHISYRTSIIGIETGSDLYRPLDENLKPVTMPPEGIVLTDHLGKILGIKIGDILTVEVLEGGRPVRHVPVAGMVSQYIGLSGYMDLSALNRLMQEGHAISGVYMAADQRFLPVIYKQLYEMPRVAGTEVRRQALKNFRETMNRQMLVFTFIVTILSATIAFGVVYNSSRISLSERSRELASLRVLGFTKAEISYILLGELGFLTMAAILPGFLIGLGLAAYLIANLQTDLFRVPLIVEPRTYAFSATVVLISALISGIIVWRRLDHLDLIAVLKTKE